MIYRLSYLWYTLIGTFVAIFIGLLTSSLTKLQDPRDVDPQLLAPFVRKFIKPRQHPNGLIDGIIYTYTKDSKDSSRVNISLEKSRTDTE